MDCLWEKEIEKPKPSVLRILIKTYGLQILLIGVVVAVIQIITRSLQPYFLASLVEFFVQNQTDISESQAYVSALGIVMCGLIPAIVFHYLHYSFLRIGTQIRLGLSGLIYKKCLQSSRSTSKGDLSARAINIMSSDFDEYDVAIANIDDIWMRPLEVCIYGYIMYQEVGFACVVGILFLLSFIPLQIWCGKMSTYYYAVNSDITDSRIKIMNEIIQGIHVIKMYAWEKSFANLVDKIRIKEMDGFKAMYNIHTILSATNCVSTISVFLSIMTYIYFGGTLNARKVFFISCFFNTLKEGMIIDWPESVMFCTHLYVSSQRISNLLLEGNKSTNLKRQVYSESVNKCLHFNNVSARWETNSESTVPHLKNLNLKIESGSLLGVIGQVGSGKSTLLNLILGEIPITEGILTVNGTISYASQEPWIFEGTIRENIVFVDEYNPLRYSEVVGACALLKDFQMFSKGDETQIGERGVTLSGGQKARISLARALYRQADIYLLDDPLSAVDTEVGRHIYKECLEKFLNGKIRILVTHQHQYLKNVEKIIIINNGVIVNEGSYEIIHKTNSFLRHSESVDNSKDKCRDFQKQQSTINEIDNQEIPRNIPSKRKGGFNWESNFFYFGALGNPYIVGGLVLLMIVNKFTLTSVDLCLSKWYVFLKHFNLKLIIYSVFQGKLGARNSKERYYFT